MIFEDKTPESDVDVIRYVIWICRKYINDAGIKQLGNVYAYFTNLCKQEVDKGNWGSIVSKAHKWADSNQPRDGPQKIGEILNRLTNKTGG